MSVKNQGTPAKATDKKMKINGKSKPKMKAGPPKKTAQQKADHAARMAIASGDAMKDEAARKTALDARTLYIRFSEAFPKTADDIKELHSDIKFVRTPRMAGKEKDGINYAFVEFGGPEECKAAKNKLATTQYKGKEVYVDFVGENSTAKKKSAKAKGGLNPTRLFVCGLAKGIDKRNLKEMFPKAAHADIPQKSKKKGSSYGFVQFSTPADAKAAFDAAQDLTINNHKITVLFAKGEKEKKNRESTGEKRKSAEDTNDADVKKVKVDKSEKELELEKQRKQRKEERKANGTFKKGNKAVKEDKNDAIDEEKSNKVKKEKLIKAEKKDEEESEKKDEEESESEEEEQLDEDDDDDDDDDDEDESDEEDGEQDVANGADKESEDEEDEDEDNADDDDDEDDDDDDDDDDE